MSRLFDKIFNSKGHVSRQKTKAYFKDELSEKERNEIEQVLEDSAFEKEAFEGFENSPESIHLLDKLEGQFNPNEKKKIIPLWTISIAASVAIIIGVFWFSNENESINDQKLEPIAENTISIKKVKEDTIREIKIPRKKATEENSKLKEIKIAEKAPEKKNTQQFDIQKQTPKPTIIEEPVSEPDDNVMILAENAEPSAEIEELSFENSINDNRLMQKSNSSISSIQKESPEKNDDKWNTENKLSVLNIMADKATTDMYGAEYVLGYKTVNNAYRDNEVNDSLESIGNKLEQGTRVRSTSSAFEDKAIVSEQFKLEESKAYLAYDKVLHSALSKLKDEEYKLAISYFDDILNSYSDDLNALFYKGIALIELKKYDAAIQNFDLVINQQNLILSGDAQWQKAIALEQMNETEKAIELLKSISDSIYHPHAVEAKEKIMLLERK